MIINLFEEIDGEIIYEEWKSIKGYENRFEISSFGRVKSLARKRVINDLLLNPHKNTDGYLKVTLSDANNARKQLSVHVLVGRHFISNPKNKPEVNHKWGNKEDNRKWQLEWTTHIENIEHSKKIGLSPKGITSVAHKLTEVQVLEIFNNNLPQRKIAKIYNISASAVAYIKQGKSWSHLTGKHKKR